MDIDLKYFLTSIGITSGLFAVHLLLLNYANESVNKSLIPTPFVLWIIINILSFIVIIIINTFTSNQRSWGFYLGSTIYAFIMGIIIYKNLWHKFH